MSQRRVLDQERTASQSFLDDMVREDKDKAFVIHFDREVELLQDLTSSREKLESCAPIAGHVPNRSAERRRGSGRGSVVAAPCSTMPYIWPLTK